MKKLINKKLNNRSGYSLVELLACIIVLVLVTGIITVVVNLSVKYYTQSMRQSAADILCASLSTAVQEELEYSMKVVPATDGSDSFTYWSRARNHGGDCTIGSASGRAVITNDNGSFPLVNESSYVDGITAGVSATYDGAKFAVTINIYDLDGTTKLSTNSFNVYPLNKGN